MEMLGAIGVLSLLVGLSASTVSNYMGGAKKEGTGHIARTLNDAVAKYNQSVETSSVVDAYGRQLGTTLTALVPRYAAGGGMLVTGLPEYDVLYRLTRGYQPRGGKVGPFFNPYLHPVFSKPGEDPYRAVWVNGTTDQDPGRFVLIGDGQPVPVRPDGAAYENLTPNAIGIVGFESGSQSYDPPINSVGPLMVLSGRPGRDAVYAAESVTGTSGQHRLSLSSSSGGTVSPSGEFLGGGTVSFAAIPSTADWEFAYWTGDLAGYPSEGSMDLERDMQAGAVFRPVPVEIEVLASPVNAGHTQGTGTYNRGDVFNIAAYPLPGWTFLGWAAGPVHTQDLYSASSSVVARGNHKFIAQFAPTEQLSSAVLNRTEPTLANLGGEDGAPVLVAPTPTPIPAPTPYYGFNWATGESEAPGTSALSGPFDLLLGQLTPYTLSTADTSGALRLNGSLMISLPTGVSLAALPDTVRGSKGTVLQRSVGKRQSQQYASWGGTMQPYEIFEVPLALRGVSAGAYELTGAVYSTGGFQTTTMPVTVWGSSLGWGSTSWGSGWWGSNTWDSQWGSGGSAWGSGWLLLP